MPKGNPDIQTNNYILLTGYGVVILKSKLTNVY